MTTLKFSFVNCVDFFDDRIIRKGQLLNVPFSWTTYNRELHECLRILLSHLYRHFIVVVYLNCWLIRISKLHLLVCNCSCYIYTFRHNQTTKCDYEFMIAATNLGTTFLLKHLNLILMLSRLISIPRAKTHHSRALAEVMPWMVLWVLKPNMCKKLLIGVLETHLI